jgi:hypothetical protein
MFTYTYTKRQLKLLKNNMKIPLLIILYIGYYKKQRIINQTNNTNNVSNSVVILQVDQASY